MQLEDYLEFDACDRIRVKGTRIPIEIIIEEYRNAAAAEEIVRNYYPALTLEQVFAVLTYYLHHRAEVDAYVERNLQADESAHQEYEKQGVPNIARRLQEIRARQGKNLKTA